MANVSVIVPNYNHAHFLSHRLDSILSQTLCDFEVIILDDASVDNSRQVIRRYLTDPRVRFYPSEANSGSPFAQWNRGVALARGDYVWIAESDDYAEATLLETLVPLLRGNPRVGLAYCQSWKVDSRGNVNGSYEDWTKDLDCKRWQGNFINNGRDECVRYLLWKNTVPNASAVLFRREAFLSVGGALTDMQLCGDWMTWARMLLISDVAFVSQPLNYFRFHEGTMRSTTTRRRYLGEMWSVQRFILQSCRVRGPARRKIERDVWNEYITQMRSAPSGKKWRELSGLLMFWQIPFRNPVLSVWVILQRALRFLVKVLAERRRGPRSAL